MSRSNPTDFAENPATRFFDWAGGEGKLVYYDREKKENIEVELPFRFLVLDEVATVGGGIDRDGTYIGYWSNAIRPRDAKVSEFTVRSAHNGQSRVEQVGTWNEVKAQLAGAKYIKGLYIAYYDDEGELSLGYLKIRGAALTPWIELGKDHKNIYAGAYSITDKASKKKGSNTYFEPVFKWTDKVKEETDQAATALDRDVLQPYLTAYFAQQGQVAAAATVGGLVVEPHEEYTGSPEPEPEYEDDIPF